MTSLKQRAANRRNARRSTGPRTKEGQRRVSLNAFKHGLTTPIEATPWASAVSGVEALLEADGLAAEVRHELARRIVEYERNVEYQRQRFQEVKSGAPREQVIPDAAKKDFDIAAQIGALRDQRQTRLLGMDRPLAREMQKFFEQIASRQVREANRDAARELKNADRYLRRAANQLIKQLKSLGDLSNLQNEPI